MIRTGGDRRCIGKIDNKSAEEHACANFIIFQIKWMQKHISVYIKNQEFANHVFSSFRRHPIKRHNDVVNFKCYIFIQITYYFVGRPLRLRICTTDIWPLIRLEG